MFLAIFDDFKTQVPKSRVLIIIFFQVPTMCFTRTIRSTSPTRMRILCFLLSSKAAMHFLTLIQLLELFSQTMSSSKITFRKIQQLEFSKMEPSHKQGSSLKHSSSRELQNYRLLSSVRLKFAKLAIATRLFQPIFHFSMTIHHR